MAEGSSESVQVLAHHLSKLKQQSKATIERLEDRALQLESENESLKQQLQACLDELDLAIGQVAQLKMENTKKWRVEERNDWKALVDSVQRDRDDLRDANEALHQKIAELTTEQNELGRQSNLPDPGRPQPGPSRIEPSTPVSSTLRKELHETRASLELERATLAKERAEASRLRQELNARRERERIQSNSGILAGLSRFTRMWQRGPALPQSMPLNV